MDLRGKKGSLLYHFGIVFAIFTVITLYICGISTYANQMQIYREQCKERQIQLAHYLCAMMEDDADDFIAFQKYMIENADELNIPVDFKDFTAARDEFDVEFQKSFPGKVYGVDVQFDDMDDELKKLFTVWQYEYWVETYTDAQKEFGVTYTYYVVPGPDDTYVYYILDNLREPRKGDEENINLADYVEQNMESHKFLWEAYNTGKASTGYDIFNNEYGNTYGYYVPFIVDGEPMGIVCVDIDIATVNQTIFSNAMKQIAGIAIVLIVAVLSMLYAINKLYIKKIDRMAKSVKYYSKEKNVNVASDIEKENHGQDELSALAGQTAAMIMELDQYMKNLVSTTRELTETKERVDAMNTLAMKDALTGIRNKTAYDKAVSMLDRQIKNGFTDFAIAMIDLNFLKYINDNYGHEKGDIAIRKLCRFVCHTFKRSPVYRVGGDEFVVILENGDFLEREALKKEFEHVMQVNQQEDDGEPWERISAAIGVEVFDPEIDKSVETVLKRADDAMYAQKKEMKAARQ